MVFLWFSHGLPMVSYVHRTPSASAPGRAGAHHSASARRCRRRRATAGPRSLHLPLGGAPPCLAKLLYYIYI